MKDYNVMKSSIEYGITGPTQYGSFTLKTEQGSSALEVLEKVFAKDLELPYDETMIIFIQKQEDFIHCLHESNVFITISE